MIIQADHTIDLPVTEKQAQKLLIEVSLQPNGPEPAKVSHGLLLGDLFLPGRWFVYAVRREELNGQPQHYASLRWEAPVR
jgi:hypothetical protein